MAKQADKQAEGNSDPRAEWRARCAAFGIGVRYQSEGYARPADATPITEPPRERAERIARQDAWVRHRIVLRRKCDRAASSRPAARANLGRRSSSGQRRTTNANRSSGGGSSGEPGEPSADPPRRNEGGRRRSDLVPAGELVGHALAGLVERAERGVVQ